MKRYLSLLVMLCAMMPLIGMDDVGLFPFISARKKELECIVTDQQLELAKLHNINLLSLQEKCFRLERDIASCEKLRQSREQELSAERRNSDQLRLKEATLRKERDELEEQRIKTVLRLKVQHAQEKLELKLRYQKKQSKRLVQSEGQKAVFEATRSALQHELEQKDFALKELEAGCKKTIDSLKKTTDSLGKTTDSLGKANDTAQYYRQQRDWWKRTFMICAASFLAYFLYVEYAP